MPACPLQPESFRDWDRGPQQLGVALLQRGSQRAPCVNPHGLRGLRWEGLPGDPDPVREFGPRTLPLWKAVLLEFTIFSANSLRAEQWRGTCWPLRLGLMSIFVVLG